MKVHAQTERLILREWEPSDLDAYCKIVSDPEVMVHIGEGKARERAYAEEFVSRMIQLQSERGWNRFAVEHRESGELMGFSGLDDTIGRLDFGWRFAKKFWGAGYGYEAAAAALWIARNTFSLEQITSQSYPENVGSIRIIEKMGMTQIGKGEDYSRPVFVFGFAEEWPEGLK